MRFSEAKGQRHRRIDPSQERHPCAECVISRPSVNPNKKQASLIDLPGVPELADLLADSLPLFPVRNTTAVERLIQIETM